MNQDKKDTPAAPDLPRAKIKARPRFSIIWIVPLIAGVASACLIFQNFRQRGPLITIQFVDGTGIQENQTVLKYRGVRVGAVQSVRMTSDAQHVEVRARLAATAKSLARNGSLFWIVRPEVGAGGLRALETVVTGPYIQVEPGDGKEQKQFVGVEIPPIRAAPEGGMEIIVTTPQLPTLSVGSPVYYRGVEVGSVRYFVLGDDGTAVNIHLLIDTNYAPLVRVDSKFWNAGGIKLDLKFFKLDVNAQSLKSLVIGGIAFATPASPGPPANANAVFLLNRKVEDEWLKWSPSIQISNTKIKLSDHSSPSILLNDIDQIPQ